MTTVLFVGQLPLESLGLMTLSAVTKKSGHECYVHIGSQRGLIRAIRELKPKVIAISCTTPQHRWLTSVVGRIRSANVSSRIVVGGPHPTIYPEILDRLNIDAICIGEGDHSFVELLEVVDAGEPWPPLPNIAFKQSGRIVGGGVRPPIESLDALPFADRSLFDGYKWIRNSPVRSFMTSRGCQHGCGFCINSYLRRIYSNIGVFPRQRSPEHVIAEICCVQKQYSFEIVRFEDDCLIQNAEWMDRFLLLYAERVGLPFEMLARFDQLLEEEKVRMLARAGCNLISLGLETGDEELRSGVLGKKISDTQIRKTCQWLRKYGIQTRLFSMFGLPGETLSQAKRTVLMNQELSPDYVWSALFQAYRGLPLSRCALDQGFLSEDDLVDFDSFCDFRCTPLMMEEIESIVRLQKLFPWLISFPGTLNWVDNLVKFPSALPYNLAHDVYALLTDLRMSREGNCGQLALRALRNWREVYGAGGV